MPTMGGGGIELFWCYRSALKYFRGTVQYIDGRRYRIADRKFCKRDKFYHYKLEAA